MYGRDRTEEMQIHVLNLRTLHQAHGPVHRGELARQLERILRPLALARGHVGSSRSPPSLS